MITLRFFNALVNEKQRENEFVPLQSETLPRRNLFKNPFVNEAFCLKYEIKKNYNKFKL